MTRDEALDKIKKLLRMKRGGTQSEIETALALAAEMARKHGIEIESVDPDHEPAQPLGMADAVTSARIQWECKYAGLVCQQFFNVSSVLQRAGSGKWRGWRFGADYRITFIGTRRDIDIALYVYHFLVRQFRRSWNTRTSRIRNRQAFLYGMYHGLCSKLDEQRQAQVSGQGLILLDRQLARRDQFIKDNIGETSPQNAVPDSDATAAKVAGYIAGRNTEIRSGLTSAGAAIQLLPHSV